MVEATGGESIGTWAALALRACLDRLASGGSTEWQRITVLDAWTDSSESFCVVYRWDQSSHVYGLRRKRPELSTIDPERGNPESDGCFIADFDVAEPLGTVRDELRYEGGVGWWGSLDNELPRRRTS